MALLTFDVGQGRMKQSLIVSAVLGVAWSVVAVLLMGGFRSYVPIVPYITAGVAAGVAAGWHTIWSRRRREGREGFLAGIACYYGSIVIFWAVWFAITRISMCVHHGGWTSFDLKDHAKFGIMLLAFGTVPYGIILIPLCFGSRALVWRVARSG